MLYYIIYSIVYRFNGFRASIPYLNISLLLIFALVNFGAESHQGGLFPPNMLETIISFFVTSSFLPLQLCIFFTASKKVSIDVPTVELTTIANWSGALSSQGDNSLYYAPPREKLAQARKGTFFFLLAQLIFLQGLL